MKNIEKITEENMGRIWR